MCSCVSKLVLALQRRSFHTSTLEKIAVAAVVAVDLSNGCAKLTFRRDCLERVMHVAVR